MADFNNAVMTTEGVSLLAKTAAGSARIKFTKLATGSGTYTETEKMVENLQVRTSLKEPKQEVPFSSISMVSATCIKLTAIISNETLISGYHVNEVGIFAVDEMDRDAEPILYSIAVANVADYLPPYNGLVISTISQEYYATVNNSSEVVIHTNLGAVALADDLNALKKEVRTNGKTFIASGGNFEIPELGINKEATLKELCEAMVTYRIDNNTNHVRVDWWINTASKIGNEVRDRLNFTYGNLNLICQNRTVYLTLKKYYDAENPAKVYICTYTKENNANSFSVWTTLEDMTKTVERLEKAIEDAEALRASPTVYGMTKITNSAAVTDSTGLALAATEKNATIGGTLANQLAQLNTDYFNIQNIPFREHIQKLSTARQINKGAGIYAIEEIDDTYWNQINKGSLGNVGDFTLVLFNFNGSDDGAGYATGFLFSPRWDKFFAYVQIWSGDIRVNRVPME